MAGTALQAAVHFQADTWLGCIKARTCKVPSAKLARLQAPTFYVKSAVRDRYALTCTPTFVLFRVYTSQPHVLVLQVDAVLAC